MLRFARLLLESLPAIAIAFVAAAQEVPPVEGSPGDVPEPSTWMLTLIGGGFLAWMYRRRRK